MNRVLLACLGAREIEIAAKPVGNGQIRLKNAAEHLLVQRFLERFGGLQNRFGIGVFCIEISDDFWVFFLAQPGVMVHAAVAMENVSTGSRRASGGESGLLVHRSKTLALLFWRLGSCVS